MRSPLIDRNLAHIADDSSRVTYYNGYINALKQAVEEDGVDVRSYFAYVYHLSSCEKRKLMCRWSYVTISSTSSN